MIILYLHKWDRNTQWSVNKSDLTIYYLTYIKMTLSQEFYDSLEADERRVSEKYMKNTEERLEVLLNWKQQDE